MKRLLVMMIVLGAAVAARGSNLHQPQRAHPAVVRIVAPDRGGTSYGSGALVGLSDAYGLVVTNWHVVRDAAGPIMVLFPDGFRSPAAVLGIDRDWDLAALAIWRPGAQPIPMAAKAPRLGEVLTIAGYGKGWYRTAAGRCTQYVSPGGNLPFEMVELSTPARDGDSGGPILNQRGELAGVLFGAASGRTTGSYCGRVRWFLASVMDDFQRLPPGPAMIAQRPRPKPEPIAAVAPKPSAPAPSHWDARPPRPRQLAELPYPRPQTAPTVDVPGPGQPPGPSEAAGPSLAEQIKTILAALGILALLFHGLRLLGAAAR